jgi:hypothetical protein
MSNPNYGKIESYSYGIGKGQLNRSAKPVCHVFSYKHVNAISIPKTDSKGNVLFDDTLSTNVSATAVPVVQDVDVTLRTIFQNIQALPEAVRNDFNVIIGANAYEAPMKYATDDPDVFKCVIAWYDIAIGGQSMHRLDIAYAAIESVTLYDTIYHALSSGADCTPNKHKIILPWEV